jgi:hypothetical protein
MALEQRPQAAPPARPDNDGTVRETIWRRFKGDDWAAYDALPPAIRRRMQGHAYDAWSVNALILWQRFRRQLACSQKAERRLLRHLDACEALEREAFAETYQHRYRLPFPHLEARATVLRRNLPQPGAAHPPVPAAPQNDARL